MIKKFADIIFKWFCNKDYYTDIRGDLEENYRKHLDNHTRRITNLLFFKEVMLLFRPSIIQPGLKFFLSNNQNAMLTNYIKIAIRNLQRQKGYTAINMLGLSTGIVSLFFILVFIESEINYDKHHRDGERLYRVSTHMTINGESVQMASSPPGLAKRMISDLPEVETVTRIVGFLGISKNILWVGAKSFTETDGFFADSNFFKIFNYPLIYGDPQTLLKNPQNIVLSKSLYEKLFEDINPVGQVITIINDYGTSDYSVTGVYNDEGIHSHLNPKFICSMNSGSIGKFVYNNDRIAGNNFLYTYVKLRLGISVDQVAESIPEFLKRHIDEVNHTHGFQPISDIYLHSNFQNEASIGGDIRYIYILSTISILILAIACINFANMATAQASKRAKEIGIRKTFGAQRRMIISQFLGESMLITLLSMAISVVVIFVLTPYYFSLTGKELNTGMILEKGPFLILIGLVTSLMAGSYPSFYLSSLKLKNILGGISSNHKGSLTIRKVLVVFQFVVGILLIVGSLATASQLNYIRSKSLGFESANQIIVPLQAEEAIDQLVKIKAEFLSIPGVSNVAGTSYFPGQQVLSDNRYTTSRSSNEEGIVIRQNDIDFQLIETLGIEVVAGRTFNVKQAAETGSSIVLNESAVRALGMTGDNIVDKTIYTTEEDSVIGYKVIGVVGDFHSASLHKPIEPYLFAMRPGRGVSSVIAKISKTNSQRTLAEMENSWNNLFPTLPFEFHFLEDQLKIQYQSDRKFGQIIAFFTGVALVLCLIGIFGLTSFTIQQSLKEISIRKVLGASIANIYSSLTFKFLVLILIASAISIPLGIVIMNKWLDLFAYHVTLGISTVLVPIFIIILSSLLVISYKLFFVARINPSVVLRGD